jgi:alkylation response protein AidB-like acyl-CoA dehydrogenase
MPGVTVGPAFKKMGMRDSPTSEVFFDDVRLGVEHLLGGREKGRAGRGDTKESLGNERSGVPSMAWGIIERCYDASVAYVRERKQFGRAIGEFQAVAHPLADAWTRLSATQALARAAAHDADAGGGEAAALAAAAWLSGRRSALAAAQRAHQTLGALGITLEGPLFELTRRIRQWASLTLGVPAAVELVRAHAGLVGDAS